MSEEEIPEVDVAAVKNELGNDSVKIVDIRSRLDYDMGKIEGAIHVEPSTFEEFLENTEKDQKIICYCYFGNSSLSFCAALLNQGFTDVASLSGGFNAWSTDQA